MKTEKTLTLIAGSLFMLSAILISIQLPVFLDILKTDSSQHSLTTLIPPIVAFIFFIGCLLFWFYLTRKEKREIRVPYARLIAIVLLALSVVLPIVLSLWFVLLPIYNLSMQIG